MAPDLTPEQKAQMDANVAQLQPEQIRASKKIIGDYEKNVTSFWGKVICVVAAFIVAYFYMYNPEYEYTWWWAAIFHSWLIIPKWIYGFFIAGMTCKPELYTTAYNVWWWMGLISCIFVYLGVLINIFTLPKARKNYKAEKEVMEILEAYYPEVVQDALNEEQK